jgi:peptidoglycan/LPS O-acetylase OafA/YrhL
VFTNANNSKREVRGSGTRRFEHIDALRALAVLLVVFFHSGLGFVPGDSGVTLFFAVSGFIITHLLIRERERSLGFDIRSFYWRRAFKLFPPFLGLIVIPTALYAAFARVDLLAFISQIFFSYNWVQVFANERSKNVLPGSESVWSLAVEEQFYIVFAVVWLLLVRYEWWRKALLFLAVVTVSYSFIFRTYLALQPNEVTHILRGTDTRLEAIAWGVLAALLMHQYSQDKVKWMGFFARDVALIVAPMLFLAGMIFRNTWMEFSFRPTLQALAAVFFLLYGMHTSSTFLRRTFRRVVSVRWLQIVGLSSYSIYLIHYPVKFLLDSIVHDLPFIFRVLLIAFTGILFGLASYYLLELQALKVRRSIEFRRAKRQAPPGVSGRAKP